MTIHLHATHTQANDIDANLDDALAMVQKSNVVDLLTQHAAPPSPRGRKPHLGQYTLLGLLCALFELVASGSPLTVKALFDRIWFVYTDQQLDAIGLSGLRTPERVAQMKATHQSGTHAKRAAVAAQRSEYQRLWKALQTFTEPIDDTPQVETHTGRRPTILQVKQAAQDPSLAPKTELKNTVVNALVAASLKTNNNKWHPNTTIHQGILAHHQGHLGVDETHLMTGLGDIPAGTAPGNKLARIHGHSRQSPGRAPALIGLTLAIATASPDQDKAIPGLCLAANIHHPTGGYGPALINLVDAIDTNNLRPTHNRTQYVIVDGGYTEADKLNEQLNARRYGLVMKYRKTRGTYFEVGNPTPNLHMWRGQIHCPGAGRHFLQNLTLDIPKDTNGRLHTPEQLRSHAALETRLNATRMRTNGAPTKVPDRKRGRQPNNAPTPPDVMRVTVQCPAMTGHARCALFEDYLDPQHAHLPTIPDPPITLDVHERPDCCTSDKGWMTIKLPLPVFKTWQDFTPGTWQHEDWYTAPRAASEGYNSLLKRPYNAGSLYGNRIPARNAALYALIVAMSIAHTNRTILETWYARTHNGQHLPKPPAHANRQERTNALRANQPRTHQRRSA